MTCHRRFLPCDVPQEGTMLWRATGRYCVVTCRRRFPVTCRRKVQSSDMLLESADCDVPQEVCCSMPQEGNLFPF